MDGHVTEMKVQKEGINPPKLNFKLPRPPKINKKTRLPALITLVAVISLVASIFLVQQRQEMRSQAGTDGVTLTLASSTTTVDPNDTFSVNVYLNTEDQYVSAAEIHLAFDSQMITATNIEKSDFLPVILKDGQIGDDSASIILGCQPDSPKEGIGVLQTTLNIQALSNTGSTQIQ